MILYESIFEVWSCNLSHLMSSRSIDDSTDLLNGISIKAERFEINGTTGVIGLSLNTIVFVPCFLADIISLVSKESTNIVGTVLEVLLLKV